MEKITKVKELKNWCENYNSHYLRFVKAEEGLYVDFDPAELTVYADGVKVLHEKKSFEPVAKEVFVELKNQIKN